MRMFNSKSWLLPAALPAALLVGLAFLLWGDTLCTLWDQAGCAAVFPGPATPALGTFLADVEQSFVAIRSETAGVPQPKITLSGEILPASGGYLTSGPATYGPAINGYMDLMHTAAGVNVMYINISPNTLSSASQYSGPLSSTCAGGAKIATNASAPAGTDPNSLCAALTYEDSLFVHAHAQGYVIRAGFYPTGQTATGTTAAGNCGLVHGSMTASQLSGCLAPLLTAAMQRWGTLITEMQVLEEPKAGMVVCCNLFSVSDTASFISTLSAAVKAVQPTTKVGAAYTGYSAPSSDLAYWQDAATGAASASLDYLVIDLFNGSCDQSSRAYYTELVNFQNNYLGPTNTGGKPVKVGQSQAIVWCPSSGNASESNAYLGCGYDVWRTSGMQTSWQSIIIPWASAYGISEFAVFFTTPWFNYTLNQSNCNCATGSYTALAMSALSPQDAAGTWKVLGMWPAMSFQGRVGLGRIKVQ